MPEAVLSDRMACLKGGVVANVVVPTAEYVRFATHYRFRPDFCEGNDPESKALVAHCTSGQWLLESRSVLGGRHRLRSSRVAFRILDPFMDKTKGEIMQIGAELEVPSVDTWPSVGGRNPPRGLGMGVERKETFVLATVADPPTFRCLNAGIRHFCDV